jgi:hypothetical protein
MPERFYLAVDRPPADGGRAPGRVMTMADPSDRVGRPSALRAGAPRRRVAARQRRPYRCRSGSIRESLAHRHRLPGDGVPHQGAPHRNAFPWGPQVSFVGPPRRPRPRRRARGTLSDESRGDPGRCPVRVHRLAPSTAGPWLHRPLCHRGRASSTNDGRGRRSNQCPNGSCDRCSPSPLIAP